MTDPIFAAQLPVPALRAALAAVSPVLDPVLHTHVLRHVYLRQAVDGLWRTGTDLDNWISVAGLSATWAGDEADAVRVLMPMKV